jgi:hypothetical protein
MFAVAGSLAVSSVPVAILVALILDNKAPLATILVLLTKLFTVLLPTDILSPVMILLTVLLPTDTEVPVMILLIVVLPTDNVALDEMLADTVSGIVICVGFDMLRALVIILI